MPDLIPEIALISPLSCCSGRCPWPVPAGNWSPWWPTVAITKEESWKRARRGFQWRNSAAFPRTLFTSQLLTKDWVGECAFAMVLSSTLSQRFLASDFHLCAHGAYTLRLYWCLYFIKVDVWFFSLIMYKLIMGLRPSLKYILKKSCW